MDNIIKFPNAEQRLARDILKKYETHAPILKRLAKAIDLDYTEIPKSRMLRTHRNALTFGDRYGVPRDSLDSLYTTPTKEMLDENSNKLFTERADE